MVKMQRESRELNCRTSAAKKQSCWAVIYQISNNALSKNCLNLVRKGSQILLSSHLKATLFVLASTLFCGISIAAQTGATTHQVNDTTAELKQLIETIAVTGYEDRLARIIQNKLTGFNPQRDAMGNVTATFGSGAPHRLIAAPLDEPGYVVSGIDDDGYLRVQRLPQNGLPAHYNELQNAQPMEIETRDDKLLPGIVAALSIHLEPGRSAPPDPDDIDNMFIDVGATNADEVRRAGIDVLSPLAAERHLLSVGSTQWSSTAVGDRFGAAVLLTLAHSLAASHIEGSVTLAFVVQQWAGARGLTHVLESQHPDELIYLGRAMPHVIRPGAAQSESTKATGPDVYRAKPGSGVWVCGEEQSSLERDLEKSGIALHHGSAPPLIPRGYGAAISLPERSIRLAVPLAWPTTGGETLDETDLMQLEEVVAKYLGISIPEITPRNNAPIANAALPPKPATTPSPESVLRSLILTYGVSEQEAQTREMVKQLLPPWAHPTTDAGGNLVLHMGKPNGKPGMVVMAHMDEIGFRVRGINPDGSLDLENKGGGTPAFYWGHPALVHTAAGMRAGVLQLPDEYDSPSFHFPKDFRVAATMSVGAKNPEQVETLGIHVGDTVTIPKDYRTLLGTRVSARSLDDRVGCAALIHAVWALGPAFNRGEVTFVWSTREELGLLGAAEYAAEAARARQSPATVFAIDTFVSSDSPLESQRFADALLGGGFVIRAIDNSNIAPWPQVIRLQKLAERHRIPVQYGITGGGNDGSAFLRYGAVDVPLSWPLRYSHSPGELIDTRDLDALSAITADLAKEW
jgi:putative aminopeptidase FrvX